MKWMMTRAVSSILYVVCSVVDEEGKSHISNSQKNSRKRGGRAMDIIIIILSIRYRGHAKLLFPAKFGIDRN